MGNRRCVGCGAELTGSVATREHALAQWLAAEVELPGARLKHYLRDEEKTEDELLRCHGLNNFAVKNVCADCNGGWMSRLENHAKPFILGLINQQTALRELLPDARLVVSRWAVKTAFMILSIQHTKHELPWRIFQNLGTDEERGPDECSVLAAQLAKLPDGFLYTCHPNILSETQPPVQFRVGFAVNRLHFAVIIPVLEGQWVLRFDPNIHVPLWPHVSVRLATPLSSYPAGFDSVPRMLDFLTGSVEAGIARRTTRSCGPDCGI
jgi:hypothetical protein